MKKIVFFLLAIQFCTFSFAQKKEFEGVINYRTTIRSKSEDITEKYLRTFLALGPTMTVYMKKGNYRHSNNVSETYYINKDKRVHMKFRNLDTVYYLDYNFDTSTVTAIKRLSDQKSIAGQLCSSIQIASSTSTTTYFYAPKLYVNPDYEKDNTIGKYNVFVKETESTWLSSEDESKNYVLSQTATSLKEQTVDDAVFELPKLPQKKFDLKELLQDPVYSKEGGWTNYLQKNIDPEIAAKYIPIKKKEKEATQTPIVSFMISETGQVLNASVVNRKEVHPKVADEAIRVIMNSKGWKPATIYGEKISFWLKQPLVFQVSRE